MTLRILLVDSGKEWGGGTNSMIELLKRLDRQRFQVTALFYCNYLKGDSDLRRELAGIGVPLEILPPPRQPLAAKLAKEFIRGFLRPWPGLRQRALHGVERWWRIDPLARQLAARLREGGYDLLYMNNQPSSNLEGYLAAEAAGVPAVQHCRIAVSLSQTESSVVNRVARRILCVSVGVKDALVMAGVHPELCRVVHNAIDGRQPLPVPVPVSGKAPGAVTVGCVGSLVPRKSVEHLLQAVASRGPGTPPIYLLVVGDGPERQALEHLAEQLGLAGCTTFAGFQQAPLAWVAAMDVLVLSSAKEGLPRVVLEAMLLQKPVLGSDVVGTRELVRHGSTGFLYPYGDIPALARCLETLVGDPALRQRLGASGRERVLQDFSIEQYVAGVAAELEAAAAGGGALEGGSGGEARR